ncbi:C-C chemokine receptor type 2 isoform X3 [Cynoglossus semilaevis]|uniref:Si:cabz01093077.1 n=1 Tax=Cynoglossus semilaevis TaxID=244447 RepID=A0A3P8VVW9_CYNSE|nr:C-C chemokine receptor type 2-like isoform X3 [Cynoglossus semilaevis]
MNLSDLEMYASYEYNDTCEQDSTEEVLIGSVVLPAVYYVLFCFGVLGNITVLWVLLRHIKLKSMTDVGLLNLALSDLILAVSLPMWASHSQNIVSCKLLTGIYQLGFYSGTLFVTLMSVDRYLAIVHAVAAMRARTLCYGIIATVAIWVASSAMAAPQVVFASVVMDEEDGETFQCQPWYPDENVDFWKKLRNFSENTVGLFVCLPIMVFCYVKILLVLSKSRNSKKSKAVKLIFTIVCVFVVCWVPYNVVVFLQTLQMYELLNDCKALKAITSAIGFTEIIALSHCCLNPIIYAFVGEKFRKSMDKALSTYLGRRYWGIRHRDRDTTEGETSNTPVKSEY